jgi:hypothetical protein
MQQLDYRLRNDAAALVNELGISPFLSPGGFRLGVYSGLTRGESDHWKRQIGLPWPDVGDRDETLRSRQPMLDLAHLIGLYSASAFVGSSWIENPRGQWMILDWVDRGCVDPIPFREEALRPVVTPEFRRRLVAIRALRIGWVLDPEDKNEYDMIWMDEGQVAAFKAKHA